MGRVVKGKHSGGGKKHNHKGKRMSTREWGHRNKEIRTAYQTNCQ